MVKRKLFFTEFNNILGQGFYGVVYKAIVKGIVVAAKTIKPHTERNVLLALLAEIKIMSLLEEHPTIIGLVGAHTADLENGTFKFENIIVDIHLHENS